MRVLLYLVVAVIILSLLRSVLEFIGKAFTSATQPGPTDPRRSAGQTSQPQTLKKDPVCGTFVSPVTDRQKSKGGGADDFCTAECGDRF